jgi:UDP-N-acetylmuramyl pentapeptide phosphotransferase/UDP-N-acetylglucosamine-1-phosphate transferase
MKSVLCLSGVLFIASFFLTWIIKNISLRKNILDIPNERSSHLVATPRGGGLAIVISWYIGLSMLFLWGLMDQNLFFALLSGILLAVTGLIDDIMNLKPLIRLVTQFISVTLALIFLKGIEPVFFSSREFFPSIFLYIVAVVGMVWFINLFNFLDGIDAYASLEALTIAFVLFVFTGNNINLVLCSCVLGFLIWNWPKAKIFMGDVGSTQLGFILIVLGIYFHNNRQFSIIHWIMLSSPFWFDATITLFRRWRNGEKLSQAHRKHIYQRIVQAGYSHLKTDICLIIINIVLFILILLSIKYSDLLVPLFVLNLIFLLVITGLVDKRMPFKQDKSHI